MSKILILGGDGYLGWPTTMHFSALGHKVYTLDNFSKRKIEFESGITPLVHVRTLYQRVDIWNKNQNNKIKYYTCDLLNHRLIYDILEEVKPDTIIHYAEQPSAPYSMMGREACFFTQHNNVMGNLNLLFAMKKNCPDAHLVKLGTMGEYGTPNIDIEEGWIDIEHNGRKDRVLYPKKPNSFYHLSKVHDSHNIEFCCRNWGLKSTDLNQGFVYGIDTNETALDEKLNTSFHYDHIFGTVLNRFVTQAALNEPLTVYGKGNQKRGALDLRDTLQCVEIASNNPPKNGEFEVYNQYTETFSINEIADKVVEAGKELKIKVSKNNIENPRNEMEDHYYNPKNDNLKNLGLKEYKLDIQFIKNLITKVKLYENEIDRSIIYPDVKWSK